MANTPPGIVTRKRPTDGRTPIFVERPEVRERLVAAFRNGATVEIACGYAGCSRKIYYDWVGMARTGLSPYVELLAEIETAQAEGEFACLGAIRAAMMGQWQAAAWLLERRHPWEYGRPEARPAAPPAEAPGTDDEADARVAAALAKAGA